MKKQKKIKIKSLCKLTKKEIETHFDEISKVVLDPKYICLKCARSSNSADILCSPQAI